MHKLPIVVAMAALLAACGSTPPVAPSPGAAIEGHDWALREFSGHVLDASAGSPPAVLRLESGRVSGRGPCNSLAGAYTLDGARLHVAALATSKRYCAGQDSLEAAFFGALRGVEQVTFEHGELRLSGPGGALRFDPQPAP